jgi:3-hydroxybutyryl-CoA dehydrogenase
MAEGMLRDITVLGTGNMGPGLAALFARYDYSVKLWAHSPEGAEKATEDILTISDDLANHGLLDRDSARKLAGRIDITEDLSKAVTEAEFISESVVENLDIKRELFQKIQKMCRSDTIIASNTSTLLPTSLQEGAVRPEYILVAHFWNPAYLVPLVEVCGGPSVRQEVVQATVELLRAVERDPVVMQKEIIGFIGNRLMHAMYREALALVRDGVADAEGIDRVVLSSFGPRFANLGPMEYLDYIGLDHIRRIQAYLYGDLESGGEVTAEIERLTDEGKLGTKTGFGLYDWDGRDIDSVRNRRDAEFLRRMRASAAGS